MKIAGMVLLMILAVATLFPNVPAFATVSKPVIIVTPHGSGDNPPPPCTVSITASISQLTYNGLPRNNPDGSYFPGDAFLLLLSVGANHCMSTSVSIVGDSSVSPVCPNGCASSRVDISPYASAGTHTIIASVSGSGAGGGGFASTSVPIVVADPMIRVKVTPANVTDKDGYLMRNDDNTYYINDAVALKYEVDYAFKDARRGVVEPEVTRMHPYPHIADLDCLQEYCVLLVPATSATSEYRATYDYASGISAANATAPQGLGPKIFQFDVKLRNAGVDTGMGTTQRYTATIVNYAPRFVAYSYLNLKDGGDVAYEKELMIALHYLGSDDDSSGAVQVSRRAKINSYTNEVDASVFGVGDIAATKKAGLSWLSIEPVDPVITTTAPGKSAMIERAGYVKLVMKMTHYNPDGFLTMQNVTALPIFYSKDFAGKNSLVLFGISYIYPDKKFANSISVRVLDGGKVVVDTPVSLEVSPAPSSTTTVCDYIDGHAKRYTGDAMFSKIALSDVYSCSPVSISGTGTVTMHADMTGLLIPKVYNILYAGGVQTMPANIVFESPASQSMKVTVAGQSRTYTLPVYSYERDVEITANIGTNNALNVVRDGSSAVTVQSLDNFGSIAAVQVNGTPIAQSCSDGCALDIPEAANILASNEWGGKASASVAAPAKVDSAVARTPGLFVEDGGSVIIMALFGVVGAVIAGVAIRKYASYLGNLLG
jgi:hypothetical protein